MTSKKMLARMARLSSNLKSSPDVLGSKGKVCVLSMLLAEPRLFAKAPHSAPACSPTAQLGPQFPGL